MSNYQAEEDADYMDHVDDDMKDVDNDLDDFFHGDDMAASDSDVDEFDYSVSIYIYTSITSLIQFGLCHSIEFIIQN